MSRKFRFLAVVSIILLVLALALPLLADKKTTDELIELASNDIIPQIRRAASKALVAGFILTGRPLEQLEGPAREAAAKRGYRELLEEINAGRNGDYIDICYYPQEVQDYYVPQMRKRLSQMDLDELEWVVEHGRVSEEVKRAAAQLLIQREIASVGVQFASFYRFRTQHEELFDKVKSRLEKWAVGSLSEILKDATVIPLAKMYLAEHFLTLPRKMISGVIDCPAEAPGEGG